MANTPTQQINKITRKRETECPVISRILSRRRTNISFEFFPPKSEQASERLFNTISQLAPLEPCYVSVTYGAGGTTRKLTYDLILKIREQVDIPVVSHLTCVGASRHEIYEILAQYNNSGINNVLALRGDPPKGETDFTQPKDGFAYASELVAYIREHFPKMGIGVAGFPEGHPKTPNRLKEIEHLKRKVDAGADYICTQMFFDNRDFYDFCERCECAGIDVPIIAGLMPITSRTGMERMADLAAGSRIPAKLLKAIERAETDEYVENVGIHWATHQAMDLIDNGVDGIHFYTLNKSKASLRIYEVLGVTTSRPLWNS